GVGGGAGRRPERVSPEPRGGAPAAPRAPPRTSTPYPPLPSAAEPGALTPIHEFWTRVPEAMPVTTTPSPTFPETSVSPGSADPTTFPTPVEMRTPTTPLAMAAVPQASVPTPAP